MNQIIQSIGLWLALVMISTATGCATQYGARKREVTLESTPPGATAYIVGNEVWLADHDALLKDPGKKLEKWRVGTTPVQVKLLPYEWAYIAQLGTARRFMVFTPHKSGEHVTIDFNKSE